MLARTLVPLLLASTVAARTTWYVDGSHAPPGSGTATDPFVTIQAALDAAADGDTVLVAPGTYAPIDCLNKALVVASTHGPASTAIVADVPGLVVGRGVPGPGTTVRGFTLDGNGGSVVVVGIEGGMRLERCVVRDGGARAIENNWDLVVRSCTLHDNGTAIFHYGFGQGAMGVTSVESCVFWDNQVDVDGFGLDRPELSVTHSILGTDPLFHGPDDVHLQAGSPGIDAGDPADTDPDGTRLDAGAFPWDPSWPLGESYCTPTENSTGARATVHLSGSASVAANDLVLAAVRCPANASGLFAFGTERAALPFGDGVLCAGGAVARLDPAPTGPLGAPSFALDLTSLPGHVPPIVAGESRVFTYWFRDLVPGGAGFNFTNAVEVRFEP